MNLSKMGYPPIMRGPQVCEVLNIKRHTLRNWIINGKLKVRLESRDSKHGRIRIFRDSLQEHFDNMKTWES